MTTKTTTKPKPVFFCMMRGLRGCYMPDDATHEGVRSYESFAASLVQEVDFQEMAWNIAYEDGESAANIASDDPRVVALLREAWEHVQSGSMELCVAFAFAWDSEALNESYGITVSPSSAGEYAEYRRAMRDC